MCATIDRSKILFQRFHYTIQILLDMSSLSRCLCQSMRYFFLLKDRSIYQQLPVYPVKQSLVHLDRFMHFTQKVVGVTLRTCLQHIYPRSTGHATMHKTREGQHTSYDYHAEIVPMAKKLSHTWAPDYGIIYWLI